MTTNINTTNTIIAEVGTIPALNRTVIRTITMPESSFEFIRNKNNADEINEVVKRFAIGSRTIEENGDSINLAAVAVLESGHCVGIIATHMIQCLNLLIPDSKSENLLLTGWSIGIGNINYGRENLPATDGRDVIEKVILDYNQEIDSALADGAPINKTRRIAAFFTVK